MDILRLFFGEAAEAVAPWVWSGLGMLVGAGVAAVVVHRALR